MDSNGLRLNESLYGIILWTLNKQLSRITVISLPFNISFEQLLDIFPLQLK